jgi:hypothetical protein
MLVSATPGAVNIPDPQSLRRQLNDETLASAHEMERRSSLRLRWGLICECGDPDCVEWVELRRDEYAALRRRGASVVAPGHELVRAPE